MSEYTHIPVLAEETVNLLITEKQGTYVDATLGMGGHTARLLNTPKPAACARSRSSPLSATALK